MSATIARAIGRLVERVAPAFADRLERRGEVRVLEDLAGRRRMAMRQERRGRDRIGRQLLLAVLPLTADDLGDRDIRSRAYPTVGATALAIGIVPYLDSSRAQPSTTPGTLTESTPDEGMRVRWRAAYASGVAA